MNLDPVRFQNSHFQNADLALESCRATFVRLGLKAEASMLDAVSVPSCVEARMAMRSIASINVTHPEAVEALVGLVYVLRSALKSCGELAAA